MEEAGETIELGRRERKKLETRRRLQAAALRLATARGVDAITIEEIADRADVATRTFFNYFSSKEEALAGTDPDRATRLSATLRARPQDEPPPLDALRAVMRELAAELDGQREEWLQRMALLRAQPRLVALGHLAWTALEDELSHAVADRTGTDANRDVYPVLVVGAATAAIRAATLLWRDGDGRRSLPVLVDEAFVALGCGLPAPPPPQEHA